MEHNRHWQTSRYVLLTCILVLAALNPAIAEQHAILVGVWDYQNPNLQLDAPPNDLKLMESILSAQGVVPGNMHILRNPDKVRIERKFRELSRQLGASDNLLFYFSGHGTQIIDKFGTFAGDETRGRYPDRNDEALLPVNANLAVPETYLLDDELNALLQELPTRNIACIIDTCYSGDILREIRLGRPKGAPVTDIPTEIVQQAAMASRTEDILDESANFALLLAAASYNQVVHELRIPLHNKYLPISAMTYSLYRQIFGGFQNDVLPVHSTGQARKKKLTYRQLAEYICGDHQKWNLSWLPVLEGPEDRFDEEFFSWSPKIQQDATLNLLTIKGQAIRISQRELVFAGGRDFQLGRESGGKLRHWAVVIGVDAYPPPFQSLRYAANDAKAITQVFQDAGFMVTLMTPDSLLQPTKANIVSQLEHHGQLQDIDLLTVYLSGHGDDVNGTGYFLPMDVTEPLSESGLSLENLFAILNTANAKHRFVIVDACRVAPKQHFVSALSRYSEESNIIFTACDSNQWAPEIPRLKHGLFTYFLLRGLSGGEGDRGAAAPDGTVTVLGLLDYVTRGIEDWHADLPGDMHMPQQITPRVFYNGKYISLLNQQGPDPPLLNNRGFASRLADWMSPTRETPHQATPDAEQGYTHMPMTVSFVPGVSTAGLSSHNVTTEFSINILAGYHAKLNGVEFGGIANLEAEEVRGAQFAGVANIVDGYVEGLQAAGAVNVVNGNLNGWQVGGATNVVGGNGKSAQLSGAANIVGGNFDGWQAAGVINIVGGNARSAQIAGAMNIAARDMNGLQVAGAVNIAQNLDGVQISVVNVASGVIGSQIGVVNIGKNVEGLQLGVVNVSESISGAPIGLFSFVKDNPLHVHLWGSDTESMNLGLRFGSRHVYNTLMVGVQPYENPIRWSYGIGIGGRISLSERLSLNIDGVSRHVQYGWWEAGKDFPSLLNKLRISVGWQARQRFTIFGGLALNVFVSDTRDGSDIAHGLDSVIESGDTTVRIWPGLFAGVQF